MKKIFIGLIAASCTLNISSQSPTIDHLMYGVAYYDVYMPESRIDKDIALMEACGINTVRIAESTWSTWEPEDGVFDFSRLDRMLNAFHEAGIDVIVGTPTYAVPQWLVRKYPEIMVTRFDGQVQYGSRQNMDITNPDYLRHAERIIRKLMEQCADHPAVIGYQLDNETKSYQTASTYAKQMFRERLKEKFRTTDSLNRAWNLYFWSQSISDFNDLHISGSMANQAINLEWARFQQQLATDFLLWQRSIVDEYRQPHQFVTQNFDYHWEGMSAGPHPDVNHYTAAAAVTVAGTDIYHATQDRLDGVMIAFGGDNARGLKDDNYLVLETNAQAMSWHSDRIFPPYDGQLRQCFYAHFASGANMVSYWPWHQIHNAGETYIRGVLGHDLKPNRGFEEVKRISGEVADFQHKIINLRKENRVAILYSIDSYNALRIKKLSDDFDYADIFMQIYEACYKNNIETDIITPHNFEPEKYDLVVIPPLLISTDAMLQQISDYVEGGGNVLMFYKSGLSDENYNMRTVTMPGILREACGFRYQDYTNTLVEVPLAGEPTVGKSSSGDLSGGDPFGAGKEGNRIHTFMELLEPETCEVLAYYNHAHWGKYAAITQNRFGKGMLTYVGTLVSDAIMDGVVEDVAEKAGLMTEIQNLSFPLVVKSGTNAEGNTIRYVFNFSDAPQEFAYPAEKGTDLITGERINKGQDLRLDTWDLMIVASKPVSPF